LKKIAVLVCTFALFSSVAKADNVRADDESLTCTVTSSSGTFRQHPGETFSIPMYEIEDHRDGPYHVKDNEYMRVARNLKSFTFDHPGNSFNHLLDMEKGSAEGSCKRVTS
jgi:hypothetical protein